MRWSLVAVALVVVGCAPFAAGRTESGSEATVPLSRSFGLIRGGDAAARTIRFDPAEFLTGPAAQRAAEADGAVESGEPVANDYYIRNPTRSDLVVLKLVPGTRITGAEPVSALRCKRCDIEAFFTAFPLEPNRPIKAWITYQGVVARTIEEQYVP